MVSFVLLGVLLLVGVAVGDDCTVSDYSKAASAAKSCSTLTIKSMTVPAGKTLELSMKDGATLKFSGTITFGVSNWAGPLVKIKGKGITVDGNGGMAIVFLERVNSAIYF